MIALTIAFVQIRTKGKQKHHKPHEQHAKKCNQQVVRMGNWQ